MSSRDEEGLETVSLGTTGMIDRSFTDVVSDLEAHRARELSLTLQNDRLRSIVRQTSFESPISPRQNAICSVRILSVDNNVVQGFPREGKLVFGVHLLTILPIQMSFSVAEYVGYRVMEENEVGVPQETSVWEKGRAFFDNLFGIPEHPSSSSANGHAPHKNIAWEMLWKKSVGTGSLCRVTLSSSFESFTSFRNLVKEWALAPSVAEATTSTSSLEPAASPEEASPSPSTPRVDSKDRVRNSFQRKLSTKVVSESCLLLPQHIDFLIESVPDRYKQHKWDLLYSTARDGISLQTLYRRVAKTSPTILVVKDMQSHVFGVFAPDPWKVHHKFYGTGETFVFKLEPEAEAAAYHWDQKEHSKEERNNFFMFSTDDCIAVGGGGHFALWLDEDLLYGNSCKSKTFNNDCLSSSEVFQVLNIEVWRLSEGSGRF
ncbi:TLD domain-containing protein [Chloropicon primus]|nr:TLD domain-containing protein [Chloropicon primus]